MQSTIGQIDELKTKGNNLYKVGDTLKAINCYEDALTLVKHREHDITDMIAKTTREQQPQLKESLYEVEKTKSILCNNLAMCYFKRGEIDESKLYNSMCLDSDPQYVKAHYRRIQILMAKDQLEKAQQTCLETISRFPNEKTFTKLMNEELRTKIQKKNEQISIGVDLCKYEEQIMTLAADQITQQLVQDYYNQIEMTCVSKSDPNLSKLVEVVHKLIYDEQTQEVALFFILKIRELSACRKEVLKQIFYLNNIPNPKLKHAMLSLGSLENHPFINSLVGEMKAEKCKFNSEVLDTLDELIKHTGDVNECATFLTHVSFENLFKIMFKLFSENIKSLTDLYRIKATFTKLLLMYKYGKETEWLFEALHGSSKAGKLTHISKLVIAYLFAPVFFDFACRVLTGAEAKQNEEQQTELIPDAETQQKSVQELKKALSSGPEAESNFQVLAFELLATLSLSKHGVKDVVTKVMNLQQAIFKLASSSIVQAQEDSENLSVSIAQVCLLSRLLSTEKTDKIDGLNAAYDSCIDIILKVINDCDNKEIHDSYVAMNQMEQAMDSLAYLMLKGLFKTKLFNHEKFKESMTKLLQFVTYKKCPVSIKSSFFFMLLNTVRDEKFDMIPSHSLDKHSQLKEMDISYFEFKEMSKTIAQSQSLASQIGKQFPNDYGSQEYAESAQRTMVSDLELMSVLKGGLKTFVMKESGLMTKNMAAEILLHAVSQQKLIPILVANNVLKYLLDLRSSVLQESTKDHILAIKTETNIAQAIAKIFIFTNPVLIQDEAKLDAIKMLTTRLANENVHHELLIFEGLLALTNVSSTEDVFRDKIVAEGGFKTASDLLSEKNDQIVLAAAELMANLSLTDQIQKRAEEGRMKHELEMELALFNSIDIKETGLRLLNAVLGFIANTIINKKVVEFYSQDKQFLVKMSMLIAERDEEPVWHRCLYTMDEVSEFLGEDFDEYRAMLSKNSVLATKLSQIAASAKNLEIKRLAERISTEIFNSQ